jgi:hypothetical protein
VILAALVAALALALPAAASAAAVTPTVIAGNPSCAGGIKIEPVQDGTFTSGDVTITLDVTGNTFSFTSNVTVFQVIVKGGPNANLYEYSSLGGVTSDTGLRAPLNRQGSPSGLSHLCFFADDKKPPPDPK